MTLPNEEPIPHGPESVTYTPEQQAIIDGLAEAQAHMGVSDKKFAEQYLKTYTQSTWSKLRSGTYRVIDLSRAFTGLGAALTSIRRRIARQVKLTGQSTYHELPQFAAMFAAVGDCLKKRGENRLIVHVAPTGGGKSRFGTELDGRETVTMVRANESWFGSYYFAAMDIINALEGSGKINSVGGARKEMVALMQGRVSVLFIDEGNYFGPRSINLVKDILNDTEWTVVMALTPTSWDRMRRHHAEWHQLQRRLHTVFHHQPLTADNVAEFLKFLGLGSDLRAASVAVMRAANEFGAYDFVNRVIERLDEVVDGKLRTIEDVNAAIPFCKVQQDLRK